MGYKDDSHQRRASKSSVHKADRDSPSRSDATNARRVSSRTVKDANEESPPATSDAGSPSLRSASPPSIPELNRTPAGSTPYPSVDKAYSRESIHSRDNLPDPAARPHTDCRLTPEPTDIDSAPIPTATKRHARPPTPPDTIFSSPRASKSSADRHDHSSVRSPSSKHRSHQSSVSNHQHPRSKDTNDRPRSRSSGLSRSSSSRADDQSNRQPSSSPATSQATIKTTSFSRLVEQISSKYTSRSPVPAYFPDGKTSKGESQTNSPSLPRTPRSPPPSSPSRAPKPPAQHPPPPPPPPDTKNGSAPPRVDYLLQNGGLTHTVSKNFLSVLPAAPGNCPTIPPLVGAEILFAPFFNLLDQYQTVVDKDGSLAVATGYRSVARRILDRLESVFCRDLPADGCDCILCLRTASGDDKTDANGSKNANKSNSPYDSSSSSSSYASSKRGLGWGEILEWVSGRIQLPPWPPFDLAALSTKAAARHSTSENHLRRRPSSPQKIDPDVADEFREHYLRQTKRVRSAVDRWLNSCAQLAPPVDVDDETLAFAILTNLPSLDQPYFNALLSGSRQVQTSARVPTPNLSRRPRPELLIRASGSLQRLYRLPEPPRDPETAAYLIKNPQIHNVLATIFHIHPSEWEILTSGRFDGFLWSGAEASGEGAASFSDRYTAATLASEGQTPVWPHSRTTTPALPVSNDEEMEHSLLAEVEREIFFGMEALEDAFELLHHRAETVRTAIRRRGAALSYSLKSRGRIDVLSSTPAPAGSPDLVTSSTSSPRSAAFSAGTAVSRSAAEADDWALDDHDLAPDDSVSNISSSRHRRKPVRRFTVRTPAIAEDAEEG